MLSKDKLCFARTKKSFIFYCGYVKFFFFKGLKIIFHIFEFFFCEGITGYDFGHLLLVRKLEMDIRVISYAMKDRLS